MRRGRRRASAPEGRRQGSAAPRRCGSAAPACPGPSRCQARAAERENGRLRAAGRVTAPWRGRHRLYWGRLRREEEARARCRPRPEQRGPPRTVRAPGALTSARVLSPRPGPPRLARCQRPHSLQPPRHRHRRARTAGRATATRWRARGRKCLKNAARVRCERSARRPGGTAASEAPWSGPGGVPCPSSSREPSPGGSGAAIAGSGRELGAVATGSPSAPSRESAASSNSSRPGTGR